ncbi:DUF4198 domain-containing protein [Desulfohalovibrio reitneri]|uniref:DUF4198 domain-containing protein n=1 Tax=Desulfohalovibrio reitneri TaxID=1307759 RepID=UPI0004A6C9D0|nr:DUF4198 domain-containing protein [Desulfohalovibrio reitneri]
MRITVFTLALALTLALAVPALAHFGMVIPSDPGFTAGSRTVELDLSFSHPFEGVGMELVKPEAFFVEAGGQRTDLLDDLKKASVMSHPAWRAEYSAKRPGTYRFVMEPKPYWEPAEDAFIIHYTQTIMPAYGGESGWAEPLGLKTEIMPLTRPFGNYAGNVFTGKVLLDGEPVPHAEVEVELYNRGRFEAPSEYHVTQVVTADGNGVFSFACPEPGWWGFAALNTADYTLKDPSGADKPVELGAVLWTYMHPWKSK